MTIFTSLRHGTPSARAAESNAAWLFAMRYAAATLTAFFCVFAHSWVLSAAQDCTAIQIRHIQPEQQFACGGNYLLRIKPWFGRLGNNIISLANVIHLARETHSEVIVSPHPLLKQTEWDFRPKSEKDKEWEIAVKGEGSLGRQTAFTDDFYHENEMPLRLADWTFGSTQQRQVLINDVLPALRIAPQHVRNAVVLHVRSGDVFTSSVIHPYYGQPPFAFYKSVLQLPELAGREILLCAEDHVNPVIDLIIAEYPDRVRHITDLHDGIAAMLGASHLVVARSTFSNSLGKMAPMLEAAYFPYCVEEDTIDKRDIAHDRTWNMPGYCYTYDDDYIPLMDWKHSPEQIELMATYSVDKVHAHPLPVQV